MTLKKWLSEQGVSIYRFSQTTGILEQRLYRIMAGQRPSKPDMKAIFKATNGEVDANSIYELPA